MARAELPSHSGPGSLSHDFLVQQASIAQYLHISVHRKKPLLRLPEGDAHSDMLSMCQAMTGTCTPPRASALFSHALRPS